MRKAPTRTILQTLIGVLCSAGCFAQNSGVSAATTSSSAVLPWVLFIFTLILAITLLIVIPAKLKRHHQKSLSKLQRTEEQLHWALWGSGDGLWDWDISSGKVNRKGIPEMLGYAQNEFNNSTAQLVELMHPDDSHQVIEEIEKHLRGETSHFEAEYRVLSKDGHWIWMLDKGKVVKRDDQGQPLRAAGTQTDITAHKQSEMELRLAAEVIQSMNEVVVVTDRKLNIRLVNDAFYKLHGADESDVIGRQLQHFFSGRHSAKFYSDLSHQLRRNQYWQGELWQTTANQQEILTAIEIKQVQATLGESQYYVAVFSDITDKKRAQDKLVYLANFDTLTGLPNRSLFNQRLIDAIVAAEKNAGCFALMTIDVDHFKQINESLGHTVGDKLLQRIALKLRQVVPISDATVARLAGDEFTLLLPGMKTKAQLSTLAEELLEAFKVPLDIDHNQITVTPSIGICRYPQDGQDTITLLQHVENALQVAKGKGRSNYEFFNKAIQISSLRKLKLGNYLRRALERNELELVYQPKIDVKNLRLKGMESLCRWRNFDIGAVEPTEFIAIAEETGIVNEIGHWVLDESCKQAREWQMRGLEVPVSVNISAQQFQQQDLFAVVSDVLNKNQLSPELLELEITETLLLDEPGPAIDTLARLKAMGVSIAVDDFGTGYSSLSYLKNLPIDTLKIDRAFIQDITEDKDDEAITKAIIALANNLSLDVIAEGVETDEQFAFLKEAGCGQIQGFLISPPMSAQESTVYCDEMLN